MRLANGWWRRWMGGEGSLGLRLGGRNAVSVAPQRGRLRVETGPVWVSADGQDRLLRAGECLELGGFEGSIVVSPAGDCEARVALEPVA